MPINMGDAAVSAAKAVKNQLNLEGYNDTTIGMCPMIGKNDVEGQVFTLNNAKQMLDFASKTNYISLITFWSMNRDVLQANDNEGPLYAKSSIKQNLFDFINIFKNIQSTPTPVPTPMPSPVPTPVPTPNQQLVGTKLYGFEIVQDNNPEWVKIDNVTVGDTFDYQSYKSNDIGELLSTVSQDPNVKVLLYKWQSGEAYSKTNYNFTNTSDTKLNNGFTSFIKITNNNVDVNVPEVNVPSVTNKFVIWNKNKMQFELNNNKFVPVGYNAYWLGYTEQYTYPQKSEITQMFIMAQKMKATVIRSHTLGITSGQWNTLRKNDNTFNNAAWEPIDFAFQEANKYGIKLIIPFTDSYSYFHGHYGHWCDTRKVHKDTFFTDINVRNDFKKSINEWLNHTNQFTGIKIKDDPALMCIENGNELGNYRPSSTSVVKPTQEWLQDIHNYIKSIDKNHLILDGCDECLDNYNFNVISTDVFGAHFYWKDYNRLNTWIKKARSLNKPYIIGEYNLKYEESWYKDMETNGCHGTIMWSLYPNKNGIFGGDPIRHDDGFTINWIPSEMDKLVGLSNHFRRMQNLPTITNLN